LLPGRRGFTQTQVTAPARRKTLRGAQQARLKGFAKVTTVQLLRCVKA
jgi:hypothetical protein